MRSDRSVNRSWLVGLLFLYLAMPAYSQVDRDFWFAIPYLSNSHDNSLADGQGKLCITSFDKAATVRISQPAITNPSDRYYFAPIVLTLQPYSSADVQVGQGGLYRASQGAISECGLHIESDQDITVYFAQVNQNSELYTLKGRNALGTDFLVPMQRSRANSFTGYSTIEIIATLPNTTVSVTTPVPTAQNPIGTSFTRVLQKGEILTVRAVGQAAADHLGGTIIHSDQPVAVNTTDDSVADWGQDLVGEQIVPTGLAGNEYIAIKHDGNAEDLILYAFPGQPLTYTVNGGASQTLAAGTAVTLPLTSRTTFVQGNTEFVTFQITSDGAELGGTVLPRLDCTGSHEVAITRRFGNQKVNILVKTPYTSYFTVNGTPHTFAFQRVPNAPAWSWCQVNGTGLFDSHGVMRLHNSKAVFHVSILDYGNGTCTYGYFSGYNRVDMTPFVSQNVYQVGETIAVGIEQSASFTDVIWTAPDGTQHTGADWQKSALSLHDAGWYTVTGNSVDGCPLAQDEYAVVVQVLEPLRIDSTVCITDQMPTDTYLLFDTVHAGVSVLRADTHVEGTCTDANTYTHIWQARAEIEEGVTYRLQMDYLSPTNTRPSIRVALHDSVTTIPSAFVRATPRTFTMDWQAPLCGQTDVIIEAGMAPNNPRIVVDNISLVPLLPVQDTLYFHVEDCEIPTPPPPLPPVEEDTLLRVQIPVSSIEICDGEPSFILPYEVIQGTPDWVRVYYAGQGYLLSLSKNGVIEVPVAEILPDKYPIQAVFVDSVHAQYTTCTTQLRILYDPQKIFAQKWDNVLAIYNPDYCGYGLAFSSYQWYRNGQPISGGNNSYYHQSQALSVNDYYQVLLVRLSDGLELMTCPFIPHVPEYEQAPQRMIYNSLGQPVSTTQPTGIYIEIQGNERRKIIRTHD